MDSRIDLSRPEARDRLAGAAGRALPGLALCAAGVAMLWLARGQPAWLGGHVGPGLMAQLLGKGVIGLGALWALWRALRPEAGCAAGCGMGEGAGAQRWSGPALLGAVLAFALTLPGLGLVASAALDGHRMALQGRAGPAIAVAALASLFAGLVTAVGIATVAVPLSALTTAIAPAGLVGLIALGLFAAAVISPGPALPALALILIGAGLGLVGTDLAGGMPRFTFGVPELRDGIGFVPLVMGIFGLAELIRALETGGRPERIRLVRWPWPTRADLAAGWAPTLRGTAVGSALGVLPGASTLLAALAARGLEAGFRPRDRPLGTGAVAGVAAPEAANNAAAQAAMVPLLTLGLPGSPVMAVLAGALMIHAILPGPGFIAQNPDLFHALMASLIVGTIILVVLNLPFAGVWASLLRIPFRRLVPLIVVISLIGVHSVQNSLFDVWLMLGFGVFGWALLRLGLEPTPLVLGFILGPAFEEYLRRTLLFSRGDPGVLLTDPVSATCLALIAVASVWMVLRRLRVRVPA